MPVAMVVVDVPTAVCDKTVAQTQSGPWARGADELYSSLHIEGSPWLMDEKNNEEIEHLPVARGHVVDGVNAGKKNSFPSSSSHSNRTVPPKTCAFNVVKPPNLKYDSCVVLPVLGRNELLDLSSRQLTVLPCLHNTAAKTRHGSGARVASQVRTLQLSRNSITSLVAVPEPSLSAQPTALAEFTRVVLLDVSRNEITSLAGVENMTSLRVLQASHNKIEDLGPLFTPNSILQKSAALRVLDVSFNQIRTLLPPSVDVLEKPMRSLHTLTLSYNHLSELNDLDMLFPDVVELRVARNRMTELPQVLPKRIYRIELQQNYLDEVAQNNVREIQRRMRCLRDVEMSEQRTRQEDTSETENATSFEGVHGTENEEDRMDDAVLHRHAFAVDHVESDAENRGMLDVVVPHSIFEGQDKNAGQLKLREMIIAPPHIECASLQKRSVIPTAWAWQKNPRWLEKDLPHVTMMLTRVIASASLHSSSKISYLWVQPRIIEAGSTGALVLIHEFSHAELVVPSIRLSVGDVNRVCVALSHETLAAPCALAGNLLFSLLTQSTGETHGVADKIRVFKEDEEEKEKTTPLQRQQRMKDFSLQKLTVFYKSIQSSMPKRNPFTHGTSGREWLMSELRAPLNWSETRRRPCPFTSCLPLRRTKQERIDRRRKIPDA
ncbi:putative leucine-rich repeat protein (LRRP) [Trypanosoma cruzi]|uniref:Leucine-rich repeat protein (LRRP), putative n=2 Tax=Trypanosoma cruzi TaxID=5693 RepID=Q4DW14_TRYCC|nr:leucine-rich repeat protein (LRRP), putative [Trypanosoma cruzi]EAN96716.1 leucine-rich repeat protein (LRRP), putative [Trypanosoma cruzi]KAF8300233.1 putative leucine-rich repeat protein (LRRP) [Trypanosoma cruzi]PWV00947.1 putative leucine-rich repeat protein (LRRP) [Trypanosoma cruzi]RNC59764.1 putative leucine-rich repeat protein (LRRP) [Trypanosoma cruzi]|eukprot:XP_818567.1 leucine-rich repeat protein (LRRP) [Trypanosoma cruzi strain CL Brener]